MNVVNVVINTNLSGNICTRSFCHEPHPMKTCITGASSLGFLVYGARRFKGVFEGLVKTVSAETREKGDLTETRRPLHKSPFQGSSGSYE